MPYDARMVARPERPSPEGLLELLEIDAPIIQAPMAGVSTPEMAAAVSNAGALGSIGVGATDAAGARADDRRVPRALDAARST